MRDFSRTVTPAGAAGPPEDGGGVADDDGGGGGTSVVGPFAGIARRLRRLVRVRRRGRRNGRRRRAVRVLHRQLGAADRQRPGGAVGVDEHARRGARHVHEQPAVVEHQLGVGTTGRAHVVAAAVTPAVQHDDLAGSLARHVDLVAEHRGTTRLRTAERTDVDPQDVTADDQHDDRGRRQRRGHQVQRRGLRGDHLGVRAVGRRRHVLTGAVADHDAAVEADQRDALVVRHQHGARPGAGDLPVRALLELLLVVGPVQCAQIAAVVDQPQHATLVHHGVGERLARLPRLPDVGSASTDPRCARCPPHGRRRRPCRSPPAPCSPHPAAPAVARRPAAWPGR